MTTIWTTERPTQPGEYWLSIAPDKRKGRIDFPSVIPCDVSLCANTYLMDRGSLDIGSDENGLTLAARYITGGAWVPVANDWYDGALWAPRETPALLVALCVLASLSGCLTPAKLAEMAQRAEVLSKGAKTQDCADAAANAASAVVVALGDMIAATKMSDPVRSPKPALRLAEAACIECVHNRDCPDGQDCVSGHCQKRRR